ncbi:hypothetical protein QE152_g13662 [Popillia japonica]|uniref:Uncharacterized protein n=1 Tax=Popillia japonica TaxID=7064 RepID=A0AAW1L934_POPJA
MSPESVVGSRQCSLGTTFFSCYHLECPIREPAIYQLESSQAMDCLDGTTFFSCYHLECPIREPAIYQLESSQAMDCLDEFVLLSESLLAVNWRVLKQWIVWTSLANRTYLQKVSYQRAC